jgi:hypothetical protein
MFKARNGFSFHRGPSGGLDVVVRYAKAQNGEIFESVSLDKKEFDKLLDYLGVVQESCDDKQPDEEPDVVLSPDPPPADFVSVPVHPDEVTGDEEPDRED